MAYLHAGDWEIHANGCRGTLSIHEIDELGRVVGTLFDRPISGWWSERARRLTFLPDGAHADACSGQAYEGYAWDEPGGPKAPRTYRLAGSFETFGGGGGAKDRQAFGWFATLRAGLRPSSAPEPAFELR